MAESTSSEIPLRVLRLDQENEDFFEKFNLKKLRLLGEGMSAKVYLVQGCSGRLMAVKKFSFLDGHRERNTCLFKQEVRAMQTVSHFHLVPCTLAARCHDYAAILMPYYPRDMIELCGRKDPRRVSRYMSHVARAVEKLHRHRFAHNDIKLENVFLDGSDRAILGDLGLAIEIKDSTGTLDAGLVGGTRDYWPPEKSEGHTMIDPFKADVYVIGLMYWALISGEDIERDTDYLDRLRTAKDLNLSPPQRSTLERLLEPNPQKRPTASEAVKMLNQK